MTSANYLHHLHAFRGFAILNVVAAHAWSFMIFWTGGLNVDGLNWLFWSTETFFHGSTIYFALISGILFTQVLEQRSWSSFFHSKLTNVLLPYVFLSFVLTALYWQYIIEAGTVENSVQSYLNIVLNNLPLGKADIHFWYIPVLVVLFLLTPLLSYLRQNSKLFTWLIILLPVVISRSPFPDFLKPQSFIYFMGIYLLGMEIGANYQRAKQLISQYQIPILLVILFTSCGLFCLYIVEYQATGVFSLRQTLVYLQKVAITLLVLNWLMTREHQLPRWLMSLGSYAFAIFFLHVIFIGIAIQWSRPLLNASRTVEWMALYGAVNFVVGIVGSVLLAYVIKRVLKRHARKLIGV